MEFCTHEDVVYGDAPLVMVLTQVRFPPILSLLTEAGVAGFQAGLRDEYQTMLPLARTAQFQIGNEGVEARASAPVWRFTNSAGNWTVGIATDFVSLESPQYTDIDEFIARFQRVLEIARQTVRPADSQRVGLRKINMFEVDGRDTLALGKIVRSEVLGILAARDLPAPIGASFSETTFTDDENKLVVRYGLVDAEGREVTKFVLDLDFFTERPYQVGGDSSIVELLRYFSEGETSFFHWAVLPEHRRTLDPRPRKVGPQ